MSCKTKQVLVYCLFVLRVQFLILCAHTCTFAYVLFCLFIYMYVFVFVRGGFVHGPARLGPPLPVSTRPGQARLCPPFVFSLT